MSGPKHRLILNAIIHAGTAPSSEVTPLSPASIDDLESLARIAHKGTFDTLWLPDLPFLNPTRTGVPLHVLDPVLLMTALSRTIPDIGLVPTISTTVTDPYTVARNLASLDLIADGRAGLNVVTSWNHKIAQNYGKDRLPGYEDRYRRAEEYINVLEKLSNSWPSLADNTFPHVDQTTPVRHSGEFFELDGTITAPQSRQGRPFLSVAGGSEQSRNQAAKLADVFYTAALNKESAVDFARDIDARAQAFGRPAGSVRIVPGLVPIVGSTAEEADRILDRLTVESGGSLDPVETVARQLELDPVTLHPEKQLTEEQLTFPSTWSRPIGFFHSITELARRENLTVAQLGRRIQLSIGHGVVVGTPDVVADTITQWWQSGAADGFVLHLPNPAQTLEPFVNEVIPILQRTADYPQGYVGDTLNERFGITR